MSKPDRLLGCFLGGAIGDAWGSAYEHQVEQDEDTYYPFGQPELVERTWQLTDDTQLTAATLEAIVTAGGVDAEAIANRMMEWYKARRIVGIGASTLKAMQELAQGNHYNQVGRKGEYGAGNGAAMRIAPLAFVGSVNNDLIREVSRITHHNDEAYAGARSVVLAIRATLHEQWDGNSNLVDILLPQLPDTRVRDRLIEVSKISDLVDIAGLGNSGYVVDSVPLAIAAANQVRKIGITGMYKTLINIGGDTDTNCAIAGQVAGALLGASALPERLVSRVNQLSGFDVFYRAVRDFEGWLSDDI